MKAKEHLNQIHTANYLYAEGHITHDELEKRLASILEQYAKEQANQRDKTWIASLSKNNVSAKLIESILREVNIDQFNASAKKEVEFYISDIIPAFLKDRSNNR